jgi:hypothetical protein
MVREALSDDDDDDGIDDEEEEDDFVIRETFEENLMAAGLEIELETAEVEILKK